MIRAVVDVLPEAAALVGVFASAAWLGSRTCDDEGRWVGWQRRSRG